MKVVLAHEWLTNVAGSEKVFLQMAEAFPDAEIVVGVADPDLVSQILPNRSVTSLLSSRLPRILTKWSRYAPLLWLAWRFTRIDADLVIVSSHFAAHQACHRATGQTMVYYHTPMRIAWKFDLERNRVSGPVGSALRLVLPLIKLLDKLPAKKSTVRLANSEETRKRVEEFYDCDSMVLHPPIGAPLDSVPAQSSNPGDYYLCFGRLVDYKRVDHAILACNRRGLRLIVAGTGPAEAHLRGIAGPTVEFVGQVDEATKSSLLRNAKALLFPGLEDFGIVPVEAMSYGTPVIALGQGGVLDSVTAAAGVLYEQSSPDSLTDAIGEFEGRFFDPREVMEVAANFDEAHFRRKLLTFVDSLNDSFFSATKN